MHNKRFNISPTRAWLYWRILIHVSVALIILSLPMHFAVKLGYMFIIGLLFYYSLTKKIFSPTLLVHEAKDLWQLYHDQNEKEYVQLLPYSYISDFLLILRFQTKDEAKRKPPLFLLRFQLAQHDWRHLQVIIRGRPRN